MFTEGVTESANLLHGKALCDEPFLGRNIICNVGIITEDGNKSISLSEKSPGNRELAFVV